MKSLAVEIVLVLGLAAVAGVVANLSRGKESENYLPWTTDIYSTSARAPETASGKSPAATTKTSGGGTGPSTPDGGSTLASTPKSPNPPVLGAGGVPDESSVPQSSGDSTISDGAPADGAPAEDGEFRRIELAEAKQAFEDFATFVDARRTKEYVKGHITGAYSMSPYEQGTLADKVVQLQEEVPEESQIVVYCTASADCEDSLLIARQLAGAGFVSVEIYKGGFPEWNAKITEGREVYITVGEERGERP